jgi:hypothetical protein
MVKIGGMKQGKAYSSDWRARNVLNNKHKALQTVED